VTDLLLNEKNKVEEAVVGAQDNKILRDLSLSFRLTLFHFAMKLYFGLQLATATCNCQTFLRTNDVPRYAAHIYGACWFHS
jgi:hypothetical protein